jgi:hypothetical protein
VLKIRDAFGLPPEPALMMLRGLEASGVKDIDRWLLRHGTTPSPKKMRDVVDNAHRTGAGAHDGVDAILRPGAG